MTTAGRLQPEREAEVAIAHWVTVPVKAQSAPFPLFHVTAAPADDTPGREVVHRMRFRCRTGSDMGTGLAARTDHQDFIHLAVDCLALIPISGSRFAHAFTP